MQDGPLQGSFTTGFMSPLGTRTRSSPSCRARSTAVVRLHPNPIRRTSSWMQISQGQAKCSRPPQEPYPGDGKPSECQVLLTEDVLELTILPARPVLHDPMLEIEVRACVLESNWVGEGEVPSKKSFKRGTYEVHLSVNIGYQNMKHHMSPGRKKKNTNIWCCLTIWNPLPWHGQTCEQQFDKCTSLTHPHVGLTENTPHPTLHRHVFD